MNLDHKYNIVGNRVGNKMDNIPIGRNKNKSPIEIIRLVNNGKA